MTSNNIITIAHEIKAKRHRKVKIKLTAEVSSAIKKNMCANIAPNLRK